MEALKLLTRNEMKMIKGGLGDCRVAYRSGVDNSFIEYSECMPCSVADDMYASGWYDNDSLVYVSGYCGASCGGEDFPNASPCSSSVPISA